MINQKYQKEHDEKDISDMTIMGKKVAADIAFLEDKLKYLNNQKTPNQTVIKIYSDMLSSRENVLAWLSTNGEIAPPETTSKDSFGKAVINH
ncbi:MAG: hypothetical protein K6L75_15135 [Cellvibrionaceae bacterium]